MASRGRGRRGRPRGASQAPPVFDQQAFVEAVRIVVAAIAQACAIVSQGKSNDLEFGVWGQNRGHHGQSQVQLSRYGEHFRTPTKSGQRSCFHYHQPGHYRHDCLQR